jgi:hypothetical protein
MYQLDAVGRLVPSSRQLSAIAAERHALLAALKENNDTASIRRRPSWHPWRLWRLWRLIMAERVS